jgi:hypothetical protein
MTESSHKTALIIAVIAGSVAVPLAIHYYGWLRLRERDALLQQRTQELESLAETNARLIRVAAQAKSHLLTEEQLRELMRLRGEAGELRRQLNDLQGLREENRLLQSRPTVTQNQQSLKSHAELDEELSAQTISALKSISHELQAAMQGFARDHTNQTPSYFSQLMDYFPSSGGRMVGLHLFEFVREPGPEPSDSLILREVGLRENPDGKWRRCYAFADGRIVEVISDDGEFDGWEKENMTSSHSISR